MYALFPLQMHLPVMTGKLKVFGRIRALPPADSLSPAPSGGEGRGEGVLVYTESSFPNRKSLLSPALSSLGGRRGSSSFAIRGQCPRMRPVLFAWLSGSSPDAARRKIGARTRQLSE